MITKQRHGPWAVVLGASEGIGSAFAHRAGAAGLNVVVVSRRTALLESLAEEIETASGVQCRAIAVDLSAADAADALATRVADLEIGLMVYNAGADTMARKFHDRSLDQVMTQVNLNVVTPTKLCHYWGGEMRARGRGGIILVGSMSGLAGTGWVATYSATKAYNQILGEGLWRELKVSGVDAMVLVAGATATPAHQKMGAKVTKEYPPMDPDDVAREGLEALGTGPLHIAGDANRAGFGMLAPVPREQLIEQMTHGTQLLFGVSD